MDASIHMNIVPCNPPTVMLILSSRCQCCVFVMLYAKSNGVVWVPAAIDPVPNSVVARICVPVSQASINSRLLASYLPSLVWCQPFSNHCQAVAPLTG